METIVESEVSILAASSVVRGSLHLKDTARLHGSVLGEIRAAPGCRLTISETAVVEGDVHGDLVHVDGFVRGNIIATTKVVVSSSGKVVGAIHSPKLSVDFGAHFEGTCTMDVASLGTDAARP